MTTTTTIGAPAPPPAVVIRRPLGTLGAGLAVATGLLALVVLLSLAVGARSIPFATVLDALLHPVAGDTDHSVVRDLRVPRTLIGLAAGAALGLAGTVMQGLARNPLADPGLLGVNAGASLAVVTAISWFGVTTASGFVWFALLGTAVTAALVYAVGTMGPDRGVTVRLVVVGAAVTLGMTSLTSMVLLSDIETLERFRFWVVGSLTGRDLDTLVTVLPFLAVGAVAALACGRALDAMALGDELARGLGHRLGLARLLCAVAVVLLCGATTALAGPIAFIGLVVPHIVRPWTGPDHRWILAYSLVVGPILLLVADVAGRVVARPGEVEAGIMVALIGAPAMIAIVRRSRLGGR